MASVPDLPVNTSAAGDPAPRKSRPQYSARKKLIFCAVVTVAMLAGLETALALVGVRPLTYDEDPYVGFSGRLPLYIEARASDGRRTMQTAPYKVNYFNKQTFPRKKEPGTVRIFGLGGSVMFGHPYDDRTSFCGWLRESLPVADPSRKWEVINAGGVSYASYRIAALMEELLQFQPDVFIIQDGHNEFLEQRTYGQLREMPLLVRSLGAALSQTRTYSLMQRGMRALRPHKRPNMLAAEVDTVLDNALDDAVGPDAYHRDDALRDAISEHFRLNLSRMVRIARSAGAQVLFITPASKLRDCEPFRSELTTGLSEVDRAKFQSAVARGRQALTDEDWPAALAAFNAALAIDERYAQAHFLRARALDRLGQTEAAKTAYIRALEEDVCPLRASPRLQQIMRNVAAEFDVPLVDHVQRMAERANDGIPGEPEFLDHAHPTIEENRLVALELIQALAGAGLATLAPTWGDEAASAVRERVVGGLQPREHGAALCQVAQIYNWAGRIEESGRLAQRALELYPENAEAHFLAGCAISSQGDQAAALEEYREAVRLHPGHWVAQSNLGNILEKQGHPEEAILHLKLALQAKPDYVLAYNNLGRAYAATGDLGQALDCLQHAVQLRPDYAGAHESLGLVYARQGNMREAAAAFTRATRLNPADSSAFSNLGSALANLGDLAAAEQAFRSALALDPQSEHARRGLERLKSLNRGPY